MDLNKLLEQAQAMAASLQEAQDEMAEKVYTGTSGGKDGVQIEIKGNFEIVSVSIADELMDRENKDMLQDMIMIAFNDATEKILAEQNSSVSGLTGGLNIPGL